MFPNLSGQFQVYFNPNLTGITHTASTETITNYQINNCDITGTHDISMLTGIDGDINLSNNSNLTEILFPSGVTTSLDASSCGFTDIDLTEINLKSRCRVYNNTSLTGVTFTSSTETFQNVFTAESNWAFGLHNNAIGYVDFYPLSGINMNTGATYGASIALNNNTMSTSEVNRMLVELSDITSLNLSGWAGVVLNISGSNAAPDGSSGGYNGTAATQSLIASGWTVTTS